MARILVIDDEPSLRRLLARVLGDAGFEVCEAATGRAGLDAALAETFDLVLLDLVLPDLPGERVLHSLLTSRPTARVMVVSSVTDSARRVGVLNTGAVDFISKPFVNAELLARVRNQIDAPSETANPKVSTWSAC